MKRHHLKRHTIRLNLLIKAGCDFADAQSGHSIKTLIEISKTIKREIEKVPIDNLGFEKKTAEK